MTQRRDATKPSARSMVERRFGIRRVLTGAALTLAWCGLWQDLSAANLASGSVIAAVVLASGIGTEGQGGIRPVPLLQLLWVVLIDLINSTIDVAKEILTPIDTTNESIIAVEVPHHARHHFLLLIVAVTLTPGTAVVDADPDTGTLYLHLLHHERAAEVEDHVARLAQLATAALPTTTPAINTPRSRQ